MRLKSKFYLWTIIGVILMVNLFGCSGVKLENYSSKDTQLNLTMDYIVGWRYSETRGSYNSYTQVMFYPFSENKKSLPAFITLTTVASEKAGIKEPLGIEAAAQDLQAKRMSFKEAKLLSKTEIKLLDTEAIAIDLTYKAPENLLDLSSKLIAFREKIIVFRKGNNYYFLTYHNSARGFGRFSLAFDRIARSIKFK